MKIATILKPAAGAAALLCALLSSAQAATIVVTSRDPAGVGFNDATPVAPVGGNNGTTLGQQRMNVYQFVAGLWGAALQSNVTITVNAGWEALTCTSTQAVLGSASSWNFWHDYPGAPVANTWYPQALANKIAGVDLSIGQADDGTGYGNVDIKTQFNVNLGNTGCLDNTPFYLGLDGQAGAKVNFMTTLLHEIGHGLGFSLGLTNAQTGRRVIADGSAYAPAAGNGGLPSIWETYMYDGTLNTTWLNTTSSAQRATSSINTNKLAWNGPITVAGAAQTLSYVPSLSVSSPAQKNISLFAYGTASFGPPVTIPMALGSLKDMGVGVLACDPLPAGSLLGKVAVVDRGVCGFAVKAKVVQDAGAVGAIIVNNAAGAAPGLGGADPLVVIPTVSVSQADGVPLRAMIAAAVRYGTRTIPGSVYASMAFDMSRKAGSDAGGRPLLYAPNPFVAGSSVSHWDVSAFPNLLMEPNINADLTNSLVPPLDLTLPLLKDIGW